MFVGVVVDVQKMNAIALLELKPVRFADEAQVVPEEQVVLEEQVVPTNDEETTTRFRFEDFVADDQAAPEDNETTQVRFSNVERVPKNKMQKTTSVPRCITEDETFSDFNKENAAANRRQRRRPCRCVLWTVFQSLFCAAVVVIGMRYIWPNTFTF